MPRKKAASPSQTRADMLDKLFSQVSPEVLLAGMLGGLATMGGITPPLTRMLVALSGDDGPSADLRSHFEKVAGSAWWNVVQLGSPASFIGTFLMGSGTENGTVNKVPIEQYALVASGIMEGMLMMAFMQNPEAQKVVLSAVDALKVL